MQLPQHYLRFRDIPPNLAHLDPSQLVCRLWRPLYGSKQGAYRFYQFMSETLNKLGLTVSKSDDALFYRFNEDGTYIIIRAATDDFTIVGDCDATTDAFLDALEKHVELVRLGPINWLLGTSVEQDFDKHTIKLGQEAFIDQIATKFGQQNAHPITTPLPPNIDLSHGLQHVSPQLATPAEKTR